VVNININYRRPAFMNEVVVIETEVAQWRRRSAVIHQVVKHRGTETVIADADVTFVIFDTRKQKTAVLEGEVLEFINKV
jgi:thioesterase-3